MNNSYIRGYEFYRRMEGSQEDFFRRGGKIVNRHATNP